MGAPPYVKPWADIATFPGSPAAGFEWRGQPTKVDATTRYFAPDVPIPAEYVNAVLNELSTQANLVTDAQGLAACSSWHPVNTLPYPKEGGVTTTGVNIGAAAWDPVHGCWLLGATSLPATGTSEVIASSDAGAHWVETCNPSTPMDGVPFALAVGPLGQQVALTFQSGTTTTRVQVGPDTGGAYANPLTWTNGTNRGALVYLDVPVNPSFVFVGSSGAGTSTYTGHAALGPPGAGGWPDVTSLLPASFASGTKAIRQYFGAVDGTLGLHNATTAVFAIGGMTPGTDRSFVAKFIGSGAGVTAAFVDCTPSFLSGGGGTLECRGMAYSAVDALWGVLCEDASGNASMYTSADLVTWTPVAMPPTFSPVGLATVGGIWAVAAMAKSGIIPSNRIQLSRTVSLGSAATWTYADYSDTEDISAQPYRGRLLVSSGTQLLCAEMNSGGRSSPTDTVVAISFQSGFDQGAAAGGGGGSGGIALPVGATEGDLLLFTAGLWSRLPAGTSGRVLTMVGADPAWATPSGGGGGGGGGGGASSGLSASRPAATGSGKVYLSDDVGLLSVDDPTAGAWKNYGLQGLMKTPPSAASLTVLGTKLNLVQLGDAILALVAGAGNSNNVAVKAFPGSVASGPWAVTCQGTFSYATSAGYPEFGVCVTNGAVAGSSTLFMMCRYAYSNGWGAIHDTAGDAQTGKSVLKGFDGDWDLLPGTSPLRMRLVSDGATLIYQLSSDGYLWRVWATEALPASIGYYGFFVGNDGGSGVSGAIVQGLDVKVMPQCDISNIVNVGGTTQITTVQTLASIGIVSGMQLSTSGVVTSGGTFAAVSTDGCAVTGANTVLLDGNLSSSYVSGGKLTNISL